MCLSPKMRLKVFIEQTNKVYDKNYENFSVISFRALIHRVVII